MPTYGTSILCTVVALILVACLFVVSLGVRSILSLCGQLERDRRNGYRVQAYHNARAQRGCPQYLRRVAK